LVSDPLTLPLWPKRWANWVIDAGRFSSMTDFNASAVNSTLAFLM
jgi:hypothetical protein